MSGSPVSGQSGTKIKNSADAGTCLVQLYGIGPLLNLTKIPDYGMPLPRHGPPCTSLEAEFMDELQYGGKI